jgi:hypothetical protein
MSTSLPSLFTCERCEESAPAIRVEYGGLGYPICPACGTCDRPGSEAATAGQPSRTDGRGFEWAAPE